jgi:hypothetical protein
MSNGEDALTSLTLFERLRAPMPSERHEETAAPEVQGVLPEDGA